jgi:hypothetical protein
MSHLKRSERKEPISLFLRGEMSLLAFSKAPVMEGRYRALHIAVKALLEKQIEVSEENIFLETRNKQVLLDYISIINDMDREQINKRILEKSDE